MTRTPSHGWTSAVDSFTKVVREKPLLFRQRETSNMKALVQAVRRVTCLGIFMTWSMADKENLL